MNTLFIFADNQDITREGMHVYVSRTCPSCRMLDVADKKMLLNVLMHANGQTIVILDYTLFDIKDVEELIAIVKRFPTTQWILFSADLSERTIRRIGTESTISILLKDCSKEEICRALQYATDGKRYLCQPISSVFQKEASHHKPQIPLTPSETEILKLIAKGKSVKEIAGIRFSSVHTIMTHKKNIFRKLEVNNVYEATRYALRAGLIEMMEYYI